MQRKILAGAMALVAAMAGASACRAEGALALGLPGDVAKDGIAIFIFVRAGSFQEAKEKALAGCKGLPKSSETSKALCKIVATFKNQCGVSAIDPENGTPGFGWAIADSSAEAKRQALDNCRDTAGPSRQDACVADRSWCDGSAN